LCGGEKAMGKSIMEYFADIPDVRRSQRAFILFNIYSDGLMLGFKGVRGSGYFIKVNKDEIINYFKPKKSLVPTYSTIRTVMIAVDFDE
jgi:hypothetical protein